MMEFPLDRAFLWALLACGSTLALVPAGISIGTALGMIDDPKRDDRRVHGKPTPRTGGLTLAAVFLPIAMLVDGSMALDPWFIAGYALLVAAGIVDDRGGLRPWMKLAAHGAAMSSIVIGAGLAVGPIPLVAIDASVGHAAVRLGLTIFIGMGMINAFNLIDGLDGLAAGIGAVSAGTIAVLAALAGDIPLCLLAMSLVGCLVAILSVNTHPARIFLGDTGSMLIGFLLACMSIRLVSTADGKATFSIFLPMLLLVIPWADSLWVMSARLLKRHDPFEGDRTHVHHQVLGLGFRHRYAVMILIAADVAIATLTIAVRDSSDAAILGWTAALVLLVVAGVRIVSRGLPTRRLYRTPARWTRWYERRAERTPLPEVPRRLALLIDVSRWVLAAAFVALIVTYTVSSLRPSAFLGLGALGLLLLLSIAVAATRSLGDHFVFFVTYGAATYLGVASALWLPWRQSQWMEYGSRALLLVAFAAAATLLRTNRSPFRLIATPLELVALIGSLVAMIAASQRYYFNVLWAACSSMAIFFMLKAFAGMPERRLRVLPVAVVSLGLILFIAGQTWKGGLLAAFHAQ